MTFRLTSAAFLIAVLALNGVSLGTAPSRAAIVVSALGCASAIAALVWRWSWRRSQHSSDPGLDGFPSRAMPIVALIVLFVVPLLSRWMSPKIGFLTFDQRVQLTAAWLVFTMVLSMFAARGSHAADAMTATLPIALFSRGRPSSGSSSSGTSGWDGSSRRSISPSRGSGGRRIS